MIPNLTRDEIDIILDALTEKYGPGYCNDPQSVGRLQAKLSMMKELAQIVYMPNGSVPGGSNE